VLDTLLHPLLSLSGPVAYLLVGALCFGEAALLLGFVLPGETAVVFGGVLAYEHHVNLVGMIVLVVVAAIVGDSVGYEVGKVLGPRLLQLRILRGRSGVAKAQDLVRRRGAMAVFIGRFTAVFRALVPGIAGMSGLPYPTFLLANAAGGICWGIGFTLLGYAFGASYETVIRTAGKASLGIIGAVVLAFIVWQVRKRLREHRELVAARALLDRADDPDVPDESRPGRSTFVEGADMLGLQGPAERDTFSTHEEKPMALQLGDVAPDFTSDSTEGTINLYEYLGDGWGILFSHPKDFTPVCTTELGEVARLKGEFEKRNAKVLAVSVDSVTNHKDWVGDIKDATGQEINYPLLGDPDRTIADAYGMIHPNASDTTTVRSVFVIGPDKKVKLTITYPASTGRNFQEILRILDSLQLTAKYSVATPVNWKDGEDVIIVPAV
jgi:thioredoxin-dependent peroxiredoxin